MSSIPFFSRARRLLADISRFALGATSREASLEQFLADQGARVAELLDERNAARNDASGLATERNAYQAFTGSVCETYRDLVKIQMKSDGVWADFTLRRKICEYFKALAESNNTRATRIEELERELMTTRDSLHNAEQFAFQVPNLQERIRELDSLGERWQVERDDARSELEAVKQLLLDSEKHAANVVAQRDNAISERDQAWKAFNDREAEFKDELTAATQYGANMNADLNFARGEIESLANEKAALMLRLDDGQVIVDGLVSTRDAQKSEIERLKSELGRVSQTLAATSNNEKAYRSQLEKAKESFEECWKSCRKLELERDGLRVKLNRLEDGNYVAQFNKMSREVHEWARGKGWWEERDLLSKEATLAGGNDFNRFTNSVIQSSLIALIHSELSEALEAIRHGNPPDDKIPEFSGLEAELADAVIRIHDMAGAYGLRVGEAIEAKMAFNHTREHKHGGKVV